MRTGFLARGGLAVGPLSVSFGLGGGFDVALARAALVLLSDAAMTELDLSLDQTGDVTDGVDVVVSLADAPAVEIRVFHEALTDIELEDET